MRRISSFCTILLILLATGCGEPPAAARSAALPPQVPRPATTPVRPLRIVGEDFVDPAGSPVRFWGTNLCAVYPRDATTADGIASALADRGINLVRPHHMLRQSRDWAPDLAGGSLALYRDDSRALDPIALERFDLLNAALRRQGIYLMFSAHWSRSFHPGDAAIMAGDDAAEWSAAIAELRSWPWKQSIDPMKMLPVFDERAALAVEETLRALLTHVNPHTGLAYAADPQILSIECVNEFSSEYTIVCGNRFPPFFERRLQASWEAYAAQSGFAPGDLWKPADATTARERARFLRGLDAAWRTRLANTIRATGCNAAIAFSNLWRGDHQQALEANSDYSENHVYADPQVTARADDLIRAAGRCAMPGRPFIIGEINQSEGDRGKAEAPFRAMLPLAAAAYGSLHGWSGIAWFAWNHGDRQMPIGTDGWAPDEDRRPHLGSMVGDGVMLDHLRTAGLLFTRGLVAQSRQPLTIAIDGELARPDYQGLMAGRLQVRPGWQSVHGVRYAYGPAPEGQAAAPWLTADAPSPLRSDTGEIVKDVEKGQLTLTAPAAEAFSGRLDGTAGLRHLHLVGDGFATVILVADDGRTLPDSASLVLSRTATRDGMEILAPTLRLTGLAPGRWWLRVTRPRAVCTSLLPLERTTDGAIDLPAGAWHEAELRRSP